MHFNINWYLSKKWKENQKQKIKEKYPKSPLKNKKIKATILDTSEKEEKDSSIKEEKIDFKGNKIIINKGVSNIQETKEDTLIYLLLFYFL